MTRDSFRRLSLALLAGAGGLGINSLFAGTPTPMLGRLVTLPIAILFGPLMGALAAVISSIGLRDASYAPMLAVVLPTEALIVGVFSRRHKSPLVAGALVWAGLSLVLLAAPQWYGVEYFRSTIWPIALRLPLNGLVGVVIADLLVVGTSAQRHLGGDGTSGRRPLREYAFHAFVLVATLPVLLLAAVDNQVTAN